MEPHKLLEHEVARWIGFPPENVVSCSSGSAALHLALEALELLPKSKVLVPDFTMIACPRAVATAGLEPVFIDCRDDLNLDPTLLDEELGDGIQAIMPVHIYGRQCDMTAIVKYASARDLRIIEDMAEAHGVTPNSCTDAACWSFYKNKIIAGEEGGAVAFRERKHADLARLLKNQGFTPNHNFTHIPRGCNYRLADSLAHQIIDSLRNLPWNVQSRRRVELVLDNRCPSEWRMPPRDAPWVYDLRILGMTYETQSRVVIELQANGIAARHAFKPMSNQTEFRHCRLVASSQVHNALRLSREVIYLPLTPDMPQKADKAFELIHKVLK
jgi:perosamine synthetase